jgi:hypothetical protein
MHEISDLNLGSQTGYPDITMFYNSGPLTKTNTLFHSDICRKATFNGIHDKGIITYLYICIVHTAVLFQSSAGVYR